METVKLIPGATTSGDAITLTAGAPDMEEVVAAELTRLQASLGDHPAADIQGGLGNHAAADIRDAVANHAAADILDAVADHTAAQMQAALDNHTQAQVVNAIADHAVHAHDLLVAAGGGGAPTEAFGASGAGVADLVSVSGQTIPGGGAFGVQNYTTPAHAAGVGDIAHGGAADVGHTDGANPLVHGAGAVIAHAAGAAVGHVGASPVVAAVPTLSTRRIITLDVNTLLGDVLTLYYREVGDKVLAA